MTAKNCQSPGFAHFMNIGRAHHEQMWNRAQRGEMLDRLMGWPIFAQAH